MRSDPYFICYVDSFLLGLIVPHIKWHRFSLSFSDSVDRWALIFLSAANAQQAGWRDSGDGDNRHHMQTLHRGCGLIC